jgi:hypothetical protein
LAAGALFACAASVSPYAYACCIERKGIIRRAQAAKLEFKVMSDYTGLADLVEQIKETSRSIEASDNSFNTRLDASRSR